jgi:hypothetical protein
MRRFRKEKKSERERVKEREKWNRTDNSRGCKIRHEIKEIKFRKGFVDK